MRILKTKSYDDWFRKLKNAQAKAQINARLRRIELHGALMGDCKSVGAKVTELRFDTGPGYRIYVTLEGDALMLLLVGGDKSSQETDIKKAQALAKEWRQR